MIVVLKEKLEAPAFVSLLSPIVVLCVVAFVLSLRGVVGVERGPLGPGARSGDLSVGCRTSARRAPLAVFGDWTVGALVNGVLVAPRTRFEFAYRSMPPLETLLWAIPLVIYVVGRAWIPAPRRRSWTSV